MDGPGGEEEDEEKVKENGKEKNTRRRRRRRRRRRKREEEDSHKNKIQLHVLSGIFIPGTTAIGYSQHVTHEIIANQ